MLLNPLESAILRLSPVEPPSLADAMAKVKPIGVPRSFSNTET